MVTETYKYYIVFAHFGPQSLQQISGCSIELDGPIEEGERRQEVISVIEQKLRDRAVERPGVVIVNWKRIA